MIVRNYKVSSFYRNTVPQTYGTIYSVSNEERWCIIQMIDKYNKLLHDQIWVYSLDVFDENIRELKIRHSYLFDEHKKHEFQKNNFMRGIQLNGAPLNENEQFKFDYYNVREHESRIALSQMTGRLLIERTRLCALLYFPLIECVRKLLPIHLRQHYGSLPANCDWSSCGYWDLSRILLSIFSLAYIKLGKFDSFMMWNQNNICLHPLISLCEDRVETAVMISTPPSNQIGIVYRMFSDLELIKERYAVTMIIKMLQNQRLQFPILIWRVWDLRNTGMKILDYLVDLKTLCQLCLRFNLPMPNMIESS